VTVSLLSIVGICIRLWGVLGPFLQSRGLWASISIMLILLFTSGHMFNQIRHVPYVTGDGKGGVSYFASGFQNQIGIETQIIAALCKFRALSVLSPF
jgi:oligosaccharyltransferase complex subunit gamma